MKKSLAHFVLLLLSIQLYAQNNCCKIESTSTFFPDDKEIKAENIEWKYLSVPENWDRPSSKKIKIAVAIIKNKSKKTDSEPLLYIEGGPGAGGIEAIWTWLYHPLREYKDIILMDARGTGHSLPKFCPDLGKKFLEILSANQSSTEDEKQKAIAAIACRQDLENRDIDINAYNSKSIAKDLNALKTMLNYNTWNIYGVSYGTYTAQVYANDFPKDIASIILDSSISDITQYYNSNTKNYMQSLYKVFDACKSDPLCNKAYPNLENVYYETIAKLNKQPITVEVDPKIIKKGNFTYNAEDFKIAIQQGLYNRRLIQIIPMLIFEVNKGNKNTLGSLVAAFSGALSLDYGQYYCVTCSEAIPHNSISTFNEEARYFKNLNGGLSFYKSDFLVCDKWKTNKDTSIKSSNNLTNLPQLNVPVLVFAGAFDPITPLSNGEMMAEKFKNAFLVKAPIAGHAPGFSKIGYNIVNAFILNPTVAPDTKELLAKSKMDFVTDVKINKGVAKFGNSLNEFNLLFFAPLFIAVLILLTTIFNFSYVLIKKSRDNIHKKLLMLLIILTSLIGLFTIIGLIMALNTTAQQNFYVLAFGLPNTYTYLFTLQWVFITLTFIAILYFLFKIKSLSNASTMATILFSLVLVGVYFQYWGFLF